MVSDPRERRTADRTTDELYRLLASEYRREVLSYLAWTTDGRATVGTLVDRIAEPDADASAAGDRLPSADERPDVPEPVAGRSATTDADRESVRAQLLHVHLPKLDDADLVEYDPDSGTVEYERAETAEALLRVTE